MFNYMKKVTILISSALMLFTMNAMAQDAGQYLSKEPAENKNMKPEQTEYYSPVPKVVTPGATCGAAPSDAIILFDGKNLDNWVSSKDGGPAQWTVSDGAMTVKKGTGPIHTKQSFGDCQLHIEWRTPSPAHGEGQDRGNSGVFLQSQYELQVLDSYKSKTYVNGQAGSIYKDSPPLVNACLPPGEWQTYDIIYQAPVFNADGSVKTPAYETVLQNGVLIQDHVPIKGKTLYIGKHYYEKHGPLPLELQDHGHAVSYRNIWIRPL
jgi:hypothetical protein